MHADALAVADQAGGVLHADDGGEAVLPRDHGAVGCSGAARGKANSAGLMSSAI